MCLLYFVLSKADLFRAKKSTITSKNKNKKKQSKRLKYREKERQIWRLRETDRQKDVLRDRETDRFRGKQTERQIERQTEIHIYTFPYLHLWLRQHLLLRAPFPVGG
jgi:hypothetical protein